MRMKATASCGVADCTWRRPNCSRSCGRPRLGAKISAGRPAAAWNRSPVPLPPRIPRAWNRPTASHPSSPPSLPRHRHERPRPLGMGRGEEIDIGAPRRRPSALRSPSRPRRGSRASSIRSSGVPTRTRSERPAARSKDEPRRRPFAGAPIVAHVPEHVEIGDRAGHEDKVERSSPGPGTRCGHRRLPRTEPAERSRHRDAHGLAARRPPSVPHSTRTLDPHVTRGGLEAHGHACAHRLIASSACTPITESCGPVIPASVMAAVPPG
jgi:hypothetical protein